MGFPQEEVKKALEGQKYNEVTGVYLLLGRKAGEVCVLAAKHVRLLQKSLALWISNPLRFDPFPVRRRRLAVRHQPGPEVSAQQRTERPRPIARPLPQHVSQSEAAALQ